MILPCAVEHGRDDIEIANTFNPYYMATPNKGNRGFASMDPQKQREIASKGGKAAHQSGRAHEFTSEEAREAGRKGGQARNER